MQMPELHDDQKQSSAQVQERVANLTDLGNLMMGPGGRPLLVALRVNGKDVLVRVCRANGPPPIQHAPCNETDVLVRGYYVLGRRVFLTGSAGLRNYLQTPSHLDRVCEGLRRRRDAETHTAPSQLRFMGEPECSLMRWNGKWYDLSRHGNGHAVVGIDLQAEAVYAIRLRQDGEPLEISAAYVAQLDSHLIDWRPVCLMPHGKRLVDTSRLVRDIDGHPLALVTLEGGEQRLLTIDKHRQALWGDPMGCPGIAFDADDGYAMSRIKDAPRMTSILTQKRVSDGYLVHRHPLQRLEMGQWSFLQACSY